MTAALLSESGVGRIIGRSAGRGWSSRAPALVVATVVVASLLRTDVAAWDVIRYGAYWILCLVVPGRLVSRALCGPRPRWMEDVAFGAVTGLSLEMLTSAALRSIGVRDAARWWWVLVVVLFAVVPALRRHWRAADYAPVAARHAWASAAVATTLLVSMDVNWFRTTPLPNAGGAVYFDLWWHLGIVNELLRSAQPDVAQVSGVDLVYHTFSHMHLASASLQTGISPDVVLFRLGNVPLVLVLLGVIAALARQVTGRPWTAPFACWVSTVALASSMLWPGFPVTAPAPIRFHSPSHTMVSALVVAAAAVAVTILRGTGRRTAWLWLGLVAFVCSGVKPSGLVILLGGTGLAFVAVAVRRRSIPWPLVGACVFLAVLNLRGSAGAEDTGTIVSLFGTLSVFPAYRLMTGDNSLRAVNNGLVLDSLSSWRAVFAAALMSVWLVGTRLLTLIGIALNFRRRERADPVAWWLLGAVITGWLAFVVIDQDGFGQVYFVETAMPFGAVLTAWYATTLFDGRPRRLVQSVMAIGVLVGVGVSLAAASAFRALSTDDHFGVVDEVMTPLLVGGALAVAAAWVWHSQRDRWHVRGLGVACILAVVIGTSVASTVDHSSGFAASWLEPVEYPDDPNALNYVSAAQLDAAAWLRDNAAADDVLVTNLHCRPVPNRENCDARAFWLSAVSRRRVVLEGWAYAPGGRARHGENGRYFSLQPAQYVERFELSTAVFEAPTAAVVGELEQTYGADWYVGVRAAGPISDELARFADVAFDNGDVVIYRRR